MSVQNAIKLFEIQILNENVSSSGTLVVLFLLWFSQCFSELWCIMIFFVLLWRKMNISFCELSQICSFSKFEVHKTNYLIFISGWLPTNLENIIASINLICGNTSFHQMFSYGETFRFFVPIISGDERWNYNLTNAFLKAYI